MIVIEGKKYFNAGELAEAVQIPLYTIKSYLKSGRIKGSRFGTNAKWYVSEDEIRRLFGKEGK